MVGKKNKSGGARKGAGATPKMQTTIHQYITPTDSTRVLVSDTGLIVINDSNGNPHIPCANDEQQRINAAQRIWTMLQNQNEIINMPPNQLVDVALFGGSPLKNLRWEPHDKHPAPLNAKYICWVIE